MIGFITTYYSVYSQIDHQEENVSAIYEKITQILNRCLCCFTKNSEPINHTFSKLLSLPDELLVEIASHLDLCSLNSLAQTSKKMYSISHDFNAGRFKEIEMLYPKPFIDILGLKNLTKLPRLYLEGKATQEKTIKEQEQSIPEHALKPSTCGYYNRYLQEVIYGSPNLPDSTAKIERNRVESPFIIDVDKSAIKDIPILRGIDPAGRPFLLFQYHYSCFFHHTGRGFFILHSLHHFCCRENVSWVLFHQAPICPFTPLSQEDTLSDVENITTINSEIYPWFYFYTNKETWDIHFTWLKNFFMGKPSFWLTTKREFKNIHFPTLQLLQGEKTCHQYQASILQLVPQIKHLLTKTTQAFLHLFA